MKRLIKHLSPSLEPQLHLLQLILNFLDIYLILGSACLVSYDQVSCSRIKSSKQSNISSTTLGLLATDDNNEEEVALEALSLHRLGG